MTFTSSHDGGNGRSADTPVPAGDLIKDADESTFMQDVVDASMETPVLVDFWADWCGPCKQLTPLLEKAVTAAGGVVKLVKVNVDRNKGIAAQLRVQSLPTVYAFKGGQAVDAFMGALPESQIKGFIEKLTGSAIGPSNEEMLLEAGRAALDEGDAQGAMQAFSAVIQADPQNLEALGSLARVQIETGDLGGAEATLAMTPPGKENETAISSARAALELASNPADATELAELTAKVEANDKDHQARIDLAVALNAADRSDEAMEQLLSSIRMDRSWNEEAARKQLLQFFEAWGFADPRTVEGRKRLSSILFS